MGANTIEQGTAEISKPEKFHNGYVFRVDYLPQTPDPVLQNDVMTYLEEYRLQVQKSKYSLLYTKGEDGELALRSNDNGESMLTIGKNAIADRARDGRSVRKETADLIGLKNIQDSMKDAEEGDTILWASPPDKTVGYDYGFFYVGNVERINEQEKRLNMSAVRLDSNPTLEQFNSTISLLKQEKVSYNTVNDFISNPQKINRVISESEIDFVLKGTFEFQKDPHEEAKKQFVKSRLQPRIDTFKGLVKDGAPQYVLRKMMFGLENYTLKLISDFEMGIKEEFGIFSNKAEPLSEAQFIEIYTHIPPKVIGSCDIAPSSSGPNILGYGSIFSPPSFGTESPKKDWDYTWGACRICPDKFTQVGPCKICKTCEKKFD